MHPTIHSILILSSVDTYLCKSVISLCGFCNSRRILQFEDTVRQSRCCVDTHYLTILLYPALYRSPTEVHVFVYQF